MIVKDKTIVQDPSKGISLLSELGIDTHKDWGAYRIENIGAPTVDTHVPRARAGDILSGRFGLARMPAATSGYFLKGQGAGVDPVYALLTSADIPSLPASKITSEVFTPDRMMGSYSLSAVIIAAADTSRTSNSTTYVKGKEITLNDIKTGETIRTYFGIWIANAVATAYGQVYRGGSAVGTERSTNSTTVVFFTEDIAGWSAGNAYQLYVKTSSATYTVGYAYFQFRGTIPKFPSGTVVTD